MCDNLARREDRRVFLKTHRVFKDGKRHTYNFVCESLRVSRKRVLQRQVLHLGELNTTGGLRDYSLRTPDRRVS